MNIMIVSLRGPTNADRRGGAQDYIEFIASYWAEQGHTVQILCGQETIGEKLLPAKEMVHGCQVIRTGTPKKRVMPLARAARARCRSFDIVIENIMGFPLLLPQLLPGNTRLIAIKHHFEGFSFFRNQGLLKGGAGILLESMIQPWCYRKTPFVGVSRKTADEITGKWVRLRALLEIVPPGIDLNPDELPSRPSPTPLILYFGSVDTGRKKIDHLIEAFRTVVDRIPNARLVVGGDGPDRERLEAKAHDLPVQFTGFLSETRKHDLLSSAWLFASPSMTEGFGITWVEANAYGLPVVGYDLGLDTVDDSCAVMVRKGDVSALAAAIISLLEDSERRAHMCDAARRNARRFSWRCSSERFMHFIERVVSD